MIRLPEPGPYCDEEGLRRTYSHINKLLINHELIHWFQQLKYKELGFNYYKDYILESINPFRRNLFEIEAYDNEYDFLFLINNYE